jgi:hypothetical protein
MGSLGVHMIELLALTHIKSLGTLEYVQYALSRRHCCQLDERRRGTRLCHHRFKNDFPLVLQPSQELSNGSARNVGGTVAFGPSCPLVTLPTYVD